MLRAWLLTVALAGCGRFIDEDADLWPPPNTGSTVERETPEGFDPCPRLVVEAPFPLSSSAAGTSDPRIAWSQDGRQFMVVWREDELGPEGDVLGSRLAFQRLDAAGQPIGLQQIARETDGTSAQVDGDPAVLAVPGMQHNPFFVTVQHGQLLGVDRILEDSDELQPTAPVTRALVASPELPRELRIPALASDGERIAVGYRTVDGVVQLVSLALSPETGPHCAHPTDSVPPECEDATVGLPGPAAIGWLPPSAAGAQLAPYDATGPVPWMAVRIQQSRSLQWLGLHPPDNAAERMVEFAPTPQFTGPDDFVGGPRIASANRRFAIAVRREESGTEAWQVANDGTVTCVVAAPALSVGTPAVTWAHGRRLAVAGLVRRGGGTDVYLVRADAPATQAARTLAAGLPCPGPLDSGQRLTRTEHVQARDPDVAFSGDGFGVAWAQSTGDDPAAEVWFAHARCDDGE